MGIENGDNNSIKEKIVGNITENFGSDDPRKKEVINKNLGAGDLLAWMESMDGSGNSDPKLESMVTAYGQGLLANDMIEQMEEFSGKKMTEEEKERFKIDTVPGYDKLVERRKKQKDRLNEIFNAKQVAITSELDAKRIEEIERELETIGQPTDQKTYLESVSTSGKEKLVSAPTQPKKKSLIRRLFGF